MARTGGPTEAAAAENAALLAVVVNSGDNAVASVQIKGPRFAATCAMGFFPGNGNTLHSTDPNSCRYDDVFLQGEAVTLTAVTAPGSNAAFVGWSDERCPRGSVPTCTLTLSDAQTVVALFTPAPVTIKASGGMLDDMVTITADGRTCTALAGTETGFPMEQSSSCTSFPLGSKLTILAVGAQLPHVTPRWDPRDCDTLAYSSDGATATCVTTVLGSQRANVGFNGTAVPEDTPPRQDIVFRARTTGGGSGTIGGDLDCGSRCSKVVMFGERVMVTALAAPGSRFVGWSGPCGTGASCTLQATTTAVAADFETVAPDRPQQQQPPPPGPGQLSTPFAAQVLALSTTGRGAHRAIRIKLEVNAPAGVKADLVRGHRQLASGRFTVASGQGSVLRLGVPAGTAPGAYRLKLTISSGASSVRVTRGVRLGR